MPSFTFRCPNPKCRELLSIPRNLQGLFVRCAKCEQSFLIPPAIQHIWLEKARTEPKRKAG